MAQRARIVGELGGIVGPGRVLDAPSDLEHYGRDWTRQLAPDPSAVVLPATVDELQSIVRWARRSGVALVPSGGRTGLSGGAVAANGEVVVAMDRMNRILDFDAAGRLLRVQAGVVTEAVQKRAAELGLYYPVDFASRGSSQIGGNIATNAGGIKVLRYGMTRRWVAGLTVVTGAGEVLELNRGLVKNATGYDLRQLFIGSEGTLGFVVEAELELTDPPPEQQVMVLAVPGIDQLMPVFERLRRGLRLSAFEFFTDLALEQVLAHGGQAPFESRAPFYLLAEFDADEGAALACFEACADAGEVVDGVISHSHAQAAALWRLREGITEALAPRTPYKNDVSVRVGCLPVFLSRMQALFEREYPDFEVVWFGHLGDGNLHISILRPAALSAEAFLAECGRVTGLLADTLGALGGSISAEHGLGLLKKPWLDRVKSDAEIALMRALRPVFDPDGILNPGKLV
ncbi:MAG: FAD-binding oxidoreductase [Lysobacteraceae bacterium]